MGSGWFQKLMSLIGFGEEPEDDEEEEFLPEPRAAPRRKPVVSLHSAPEVKVVVASPTSFEDAESLAAHLKARRLLIINMEAVPKEAAQRMLDFLSGTAYALGGSTHKIAADTFLLAPSNVSVNSEDGARVARKKML